MRNQQCKFGESIDKEEAEHQKINWRNFKEFKMFSIAFLKLLINWGEKISLKFRQIIIIV